MAQRKLNILVYTGTGTTAESVRHCLFSLRRLLSPNYAVIPITESVILKEPWQLTCALLVFPGGADLGYCRVLNGEGNRRIAEYVRRGGSYLGFCAGGYYGSGRCEFEVGDKRLEVIGGRELGFFPGTCRGGAFKGFEYGSEKGARAVKLAVVKEAFGQSDNDEKSVPARTVSYFNGGGVFVDAETMKDKKVEVLATYEEELDVDGGKGKAAVVLCHVGSGKVVLTGPHPEFAPTNLHSQPSLPGYAKLVKVLLEADSSRDHFLRACLTKLGLEVVPDNNRIPPLSRLHLSALGEGQVTDLLCGWEEVITKEDGKEFIKAEADTFRIQSESAWDMKAMKDAVARADGNAGGNEESDAGMVDYSMVTKRIIAHETKWPVRELTPQFDHGRYYENLQRYRTVEKGAESWGDLLMYGEVVTSTNSLLDKNPKLVSRLPTGFTFTASTQVAGRGRGTNVWIAPPGSLMFSTVINHPAHLAMSRPIVFIQYVAAVAIVEAIQSYAEGYQDLPVKLKWPNDIYARDPNDPNSWAKIGGILSQCGYCDGQYQVILGIGINVNNPRPTTSLSDLLPSPNDTTSSAAAASSSLPPLFIETLLARILTRLEAAHTQFLRQGFTPGLETRYYRHWLHTGQEVTLEAEGGVKARVKGITSDWGMLRVEELDRQGKGTGKQWALQSDENSFDYWRGLVRRKM